MFKKNKKGFYEFEELKKFKNLIYGFSTRKFGDCRKNPEMFLNALRLDKKDLVLAQQVHGNKIKVVTSADKGQIISGVDGLVTSASRVILGVRTADCLPILFFEPEAKIIGICHAGWKGILKKLPQKMIDQMIKVGALPENVLVGIGPHIGGCCYNVERQRMRVFVEEFGKLDKMIIEKNDQYFLDLAVPTRIQLIHSGIPSKNLIFSNICTSCQNKKFFSYRKNTKKSYGEMLSVISLIN